jgi:MscS family membrane protein
MESSTPGTLLKSEIVNILQNIEVRQFIPFLLILFIGIVAYEFIVRFLQKRISGRSPGNETAFWNPANQSLPLRLICYAGILRLAELTVSLSPLLSESFHFLESAIVTLAILIFLLTSLSRLFQIAAKPSELLQDKHVIRYLSHIKKSTQLLIGLGVVSCFVILEKAVFDVWLLSTIWWRYFLAFALIVLLWTLSITIGKLLLRITVILGEKEKHTRLRLTLSSFLWPIRILVLALIIYALETVFSFPATIGQILDKSIIILGSLSGFLLVYKLLDIIDDEMYRFVEREDNLLDKTFAQMVKLVLRLVVLTIAAIFLIQALSGKPVSALLAGLGIGALAVALAAQDTLKNLFGSIMIMADKPFDIGQRILIDGFDGIVEAVGFRSTKIRTLTGHQVVIPNEKMASLSIENIGRRPHIRRLTDIGLTYDTPPEKVEKALQLVKEILANHEGMDPEFPPRIYFDEFNDYSLNLKLIYWFHPADYWGYMAFSEKINLQIMKAFTAEGIEFAFPTSTTYLAQDDKRKITLTINQPKDGSGVIE